MIEYLVNAYFIINCILGGYTLRDNEGESFWLNLSATIVMCLFGLVIIVAAVLWRAIKRLHPYFQFVYLYELYFTDKYKDMPEHKIRDFVTFAAHHMRSGKLKGRANTMYTKLMDRRYGYGIVEKAKKILEVTP